MRHSKTTVALAVTALFVLLAAPRAFAGEHCNAATQTCLDKMTSHYESTGWAGLEGDWNEESKTWTVTRVVADGPGAAAGFEVGDVLLGLNGHRFGAMDEKAKAATKAAKVPGNTVTYLAKRAGEKMEIAVELGQVPDDVVAAKVGEHMVEHAQVASVQ